jgi:hypothetical protein
MGKPTADITTDNKHILRLYAKTAAIEARLDRFKTLDELVARLFRRVRVLEGATEPEPFPPKLPQPRKASARPFFRKPR